MDKDSDMKFKPRERMCKECPYKKENQKHLSVEQHKEIVKVGAVFPCHMDLREVVGSDNSGVELYAQIVDTFVICRGRFEEMKHE